MKKLILPKANTFYDTYSIEPVIILIADKLPESEERLKTLSGYGKYYDQQAQLLVDALLRVLPQGIIEPLTIKLMQQKVSLYTGLMKKE